MPSPSGPRATPADNLTSVREAASGAEHPPGGNVTLRKSLTLRDAVLALAGGVIGSGIFLTAGQVAGELRRADLFILVWIVGGVFSLLASVSVAELAGMYPDAGGQYVFLREAYGELPAFLYGWMIFAVVQTGTIAALAVGFAKYLGAAFPALSASHWQFAPFGASAFLRIDMERVVAVAGVAGLTFFNVLGVKRGAWVVNVSTYVKFGVMAGLVVLGLLFGRGDWSHFRAPAADAPHGAALLPAFGVALIAVLFAYDGWIYVTWIAGEIKDASRNVPRALIIGLFLVAALYVSINVAYVYALPMETVIQTNAVVQAASAAMFSARLGTLFALMVALSCFGAMASAIMCTARIFYAMAVDGVFLKRMAVLHPRFQTPAFSLVAQGVWASVLALIGLYDQLLTYAIFMMIVAYVATVMALFVLRRRRPDHPRPYRCAGYPWVPALYLLVSIAWTVNTLVARPRESLAGLLIVLAGVPGYFYWSRVKGKRAG